MRCWKMRRYRNILVVIVVGSVKLRWRLHAMLINVKPLICNVPCVSFDDHDMLKNHIKTP